MENKPKNIDYSIIIPVYFNAGSLTKTYQKLKSEVLNKKADKNYELIFIDDGSGDTSLQELIELKNKDPETIKIIKFTRNFGQVPAITAGYKLAEGRCIINISADLQDPPELILKMLDYHEKENYKIVVCTREAREESFFRRKTSSVFYHLMKKLSFKNMPQGGFDFLLIGKEVRDLIIKNYEANPFWQGQVLWTGYPVKFIPYKRQKREIGKSRWTFSKKMKYLIDGVLSYSYFPLRIMSITGAVISLLGFLYALFIVIMRIWGNVPFKGWAPIMILILILAGIQMLMLGIIGEYLWRTLDQTRKRPLFVIEKIYD